MMFVKVTIDGLHKWRWQSATQRLRDAYEGARSSLDEAFESIEQENEKFKASPKPNATDFDEVESYQAWADNIYERWHETESTLNVIKQGFIVILYHSWELHSTDWTEWEGNYKHHTVFNRLKQMGYIVHPGVHKLNKVGNCIKHDSADLWNQDKNMFEPVVQNHIDNGITPYFSRNLILTDADMDFFSDALLSSGPPGPATPSL